MKKANKKNLIRVFSITFTITIILIVIVFNILLGMAEDRFSLRIDLTGNKFFTLSDETKSVLLDLEEDFTIYILSDEETYKAGVRTGLVNELLLQYKKESNSNIRLEYIDSYTNPGILTKYRDKDLKENYLIVESRFGHRILSVEELFGREASSGGSKGKIVDFRGEQAITSTLLRLSKDIFEKIVLIEGHGETYNEEVIKTMQSGTYEVESLSLMLGGIPEDTDLVIISSPMVDFASEEIDRLDEYLYKYGNMILLYGPESPDLPNLDKYLEEWGVRFEKNILIDPTRYIGNGVQLAPEIMDLDINGGLEDYTKRYLITPGARSISVLWESKNLREVSPVLVTSENTYAKFYDNESGLIATLEEEPGDSKGSKNVGVLVQNFDLVDQRVKVGRVLFLSSPSMYSDSLLTTTNLLNREYFSKNLSYIADVSRESILIKSKNMRDNALNTAGVGNVKLFLLIVVLPSVLILLAGIIRCSYRRRL